MILDFRTAILALCLSATAAGADTPDLSCRALDAAASEPTDRLCLAVQEAFRRRHGRDLAHAPSARGRLRLEVETAGPTFLKARLSWPEGGRTTPLIELSVVDRDTIPDEALARFAESLLSGLGPDLPDALLSR